MKAFFPKDYNFYPKTWILPHEYEDLIKCGNKNKYYIIKP
jgi:hypothetical protein